MISSKSIKERIVLDHFRSCYSEFPKGKISQTESPDFILKISPRISIGIELVSLPSASYVIDRKSARPLITDVQTALHKKSEKLTLYRKKRANSYWLVLYADSIISKGPDPEKILEKLTTGNGFDGIFLLGLFEGRVWQFPRAQE